MLDRPPGSSVIDTGFVQIPEGSFLMGSEDGQDNERPVHAVWLDTFYLAALQVTNADYRQFITAANAAPPPFIEDAKLNQPQQPVTGVSWYEAVAYCKWLSELHGMHFRLPTEAEWERAARGGAGGKRYPWGDAPPGSLPQYGERWRTGPEPAGQGQPNAFGLYDICENVHEWCGDWYQADYYANSPAWNPKGPETGERRVSRGGSWRHHIKVSRCAARSSIPPNFQYADYGFRVVHSLEPLTQL